MPVREKAIGNLMAGLIGDQWYQDGVCQSMPHGDNRAVSELVEAIYVRLIDRLDWNRIILEAHGRHLALDHKYAETDEFRFGVDQICGECLNEALLATDFGGYRDWKEDPAAPRESEGSHPLPLGMGNRPRPSDEAKEATVALAKALGYTGKSYEDEE